MYILGLMKLAMKILTQLCDLSRKEKKGAQREKKRSKIKLNRKKSKKFVEIVFSVFIVYW